MAGTAAVSWRRPQRVSMQEHMAIDVNPGPIRPICLISDYFPRFYPFTEPAPCAPDPHPAICSAPQRQPSPDPEGDSDDSTALGTLEFTLLFDADNSALHCTAYRAKGLKPPASGSVDTYVKANLLPGASKASQLRTHTIQSTRAPVWEETLTYHGFTSPDAGHKTLRLRVHARRHGCGNVSGHLPWGSCGCPLGSCSPTKPGASTKRPKSLDTSRGVSLYEEVAAAGEERGRILLSLGYSSQRGGLLVGVLRCAHLAPMDASGCSDPFICLSLHPNVGKKSKHKTSIRKKTLNPKFNEKFFYKGLREELVQKTLLVSLWDYDLAIAEDFVGGVQLSSRASGTGGSVWAAVTAGWSCGTRRTGCAPPAQRLVEAPGLALLTASPPNGSGCLRRVGSTSGSSTHHTQHLVKLFPIFSPFKFAHCQTRKHE